MYRNPTATAELLFRDFVPSVTLEGAETLHDSVGRLNDWLREHPVDVVSVETLFIAPGATVLALQRQDPRAIQIVRLWYRERA